MEEACRDDRYGLKLPKSAQGRGGRSVYKGRHGGPIPSPARDMCKGSGGPGVPLDRLSCRHPNKARLRQCTSVLLRGLRANTSLGSDVAGFGGEFCQTK